MSGRPLGFLVLGNCKHTHSWKLQIRSLGVNGPLSTVISVVLWVLDCLRGAQRRNWSVFLVQTREAASTSVGCLTSLKVLGELYAGWRRWMRRGRVAEV